MSSEYPNEKIKSTADQLTIQKMGELVTLLVDREIGDICEHLMQKDEKH